MFCKNCGKELSSNAYICPDCGEPADAAKPANPARAVKPQTSLLPLLGLILTIISFVFAVFYLTCNMLTGLEGSEYYFDGPASITTGIITNLITLCGLICGVVGLYNSKNSGNTQERAFSLTAVIVCSIILAALISCYCAIALAYPY